MSTTNNMNNLTTLIKRLEAATSRLEDIATSVDGPESRALTSSSDAPIRSSTEAARAATPVAAASTVTAPVIHAPPPEPLPTSIEEFDELIVGDVTSFVVASSKLGGLVEEQAKAVLQAFQAERTFLLVSTRAKKPDPPPIELMTDLHQYTSSVDEFRVANRTSPFFTHLSTVGEGIVALGWIVERKPADFIKETLGGAQYYGNKVLKEYKEKDKTHVDFIQAYYKMLRSLAEYTAQNYRTGLTWNQKDGIEAVEALKQIQQEGLTPKAAQTSGGPAPPPPPPLPSLEQLTGGAPPLPPPTSVGGPKGGDMGAIFDQLNQGSSVTAGLKKVNRSKDEVSQPHPSYKTGTAGGESGSPISAGSSIRGKSPLPVRKPESLRTKKPSRKELDGTKWIVENFENTSDPITIAAELNHSILISRCTKCVIIVKGKANAISIDNCAGLSIIVDSLVSSLDVIKCPKFAVQIDGMLPTILLDQVDGAQIYLGENCVANPPEMLTSKCSAVNVVLPPVGDRDSTEQPLPEQLRTYFKNGRLVTEIVEHAG